MHELGPYLHKVASVFAIQYLFLHFSVIFQLWKGQTLKQGPERLWVTICGYSQNFIGQDPERNDGMQPALSWAVWTRDLRRTLSSWIILWICLFAHLCKQCSRDEWWHISREGKVKWLCGRASACWWKPVAVITKLYKLGLVCLTVYIHVSAAYSVLLVVTHVPLDVTGWRGYLRH